MAERTPDSPVEPPQLRNLDDIPPVLAAIRANVRQRRGRGERPTAEGVCLDACYRLTDLGPGGSLTTIQFADLQGMDKGNCRTALATLADVGLAARLIDPTATEEDPRAPSEDEESREDQESPTGRPARPYVPTEATDIFARLYVDQRIRVIAGLLLVEDIDVSSTMLRAWAHTHRLRQTASSAELAGLAGHSIAAIQHWALGAYVEAHADVGLPARFRSAQQGLIGARS